MHTEDHQADETNCNLCGDRDGVNREGRLGRYQVTCDRCEARRGAHLIQTGRGYASRQAMSSSAV